MARSGFQVQRATIKALFLREIKTRFGKYRLGYFWAVLEPLAHLMILMAVLGFIMHRTMPDISFPVFLLNGIIPYFLFTKISGRSIGAIESNKGLFNYKPVKPIDTVIARTILETAIYSVVYVVLMVVVWFFGEYYSIINLIKLISSWALLIIMSSGIGLIFMVAGDAFQETQKFLPIILKPLYFTSCIMFPLHSVPKEYWPYLLWNPIVHAVELSRESVMPGYVSDGVSLSYLSFCTLIIFFIGLSLYSVRESHMLTSK